MYRWRIANYKLAITQEQDSAKRAELMLKEKRMTREHSLRSSSRGRLVLTTRRC